MVHGLVLNAVKPRPGFLTRAGRPWARGQPNESRDRETGARTSPPVIQLQNSRSPVSGLERRAPPRPVEMRVRSSRNVGDSGGRDPRRGAFGLRGHQWSGLAQLTDRRAGPACSAGHDEQRATERGAASIEPHRNARRNLRQRAGAGLRGCSERRSGSSQRTDPSAGGGEPLWRLWLWVRLQLRLGCQQLFDAGSRWARRQCRAASGRRFPRRARLWSACHEVK